MPPVLPMFRGNYDYDTVQPYFLDGQEEEVEDFYGEDIWKKFELLPTPPLSPRRRPSLSDVSLNAADHLEAVTELLDDDRDTFLQSFILQDCMWSSSFSAANKLERAVSERLAALKNRRESSTTTSRGSDSRGSDSRGSDSNSRGSDTGGLTAGGLTAGGLTAGGLTAGGLTLTGRGSDSRGSDSRGSDSRGSDSRGSDSRGSDSRGSDSRGSDSRGSDTCIDPSEVFPFKPLTEKEAPSEPCLETPPLSSSDSESEEEEEEEEEVEEEEIDVVTVERRKTSQHSNPSILKRCKLDIQQHNYAAPQPPRHPVSKPAGEDLHARRRTHNVLERNRRNDLKRSFSALREETPAVGHNEKAAKVLILKTATEFICELREEEGRLVREEEAQRRRNRRLRRTLRTLRTSP
nr:transcriptional regulator Myc-A-like [Pseudochaenichthys georgianus]